MYDIVIVGAGGFGREMLNFARDTFSSESHRIKGFIDDDPRQLNNYRTVMPILASIDEYSVKENDRFVMAIGNVDTRKSILDKLKNRGARFITLIHPTTYVAPTAKIGEGVVMCPFTTVSDHAVVGDLVMMHIYASCGHDSKIGKYSILSPYATVNGFSVLEDEVFMGTHATVTAYRKVGYRSKISANSVAMKDVPQFGFVFGVPGKTRVIFNNT